MSLYYMFHIERVGKMGALVVHLLLFLVEYSSGLWSRQPTEPLPQSHPLLKRDPAAGPFTPEQVQLSYAGPGSVSVAWVTWPLTPHRETRRLAKSEPHSSQLSVQRITKKKRRRTACDDVLDLDLRSSIRWGYATGELNNVEHGAFSCYSTVAYDSGALHRVTIGVTGGPLTPSASIYYQVGDSERDVWSDEFWFVMAPPVGHFPYKLGLIGDLGQTKHSLQTLEHLRTNQPQSVILVGDLSYADGYQPRWDTWGRMMSNDTSRLVFMYTEGNHEIEPSKDKYATPDFLSYTSRFRMPFEHSGSPSPLYYSYDLAGAHIVMLGSYADYEEGSEQYEWLAQDLSTVSRTTTPWILVGMHAPWYNSNHNHQGEGEKMRKAMEPLLYQHGVDAVFSGHVHAYERSHPVHNFEKDECGPVYINIGDGGNREGLDFEYYQQPEWSAMREPSYGHGILDLIDDSHARFSWFRNVDGVGQVTDTVEIKRLPNASCLSTP